jgi:hypothetical protein
MFGLDEHIAQLGHGEVFAVVALIAVVLGLRHATDPDHVTAVTALLAHDEATARGAGRLGATWGAGHATSLFTFGVPVVLSRAYLPGSLQTAAETAVGIVIIALAIRLLRRSRRAAEHAHGAPPRTAPQAYGIGLVHGMGGSAGVGVLLLATIPNHAEALAALALFSAFTALSMAIASTAIGFVLSRGPVVRGHLAITPAMGALSLAFGCWYTLGALDAVPYIL